MAVTEVRQYGCQSIQVSRRLHAMLESLLRTLPEQRAPALRGELEVLNRVVSKSFAEPEDQDMAADSDSQGVGGRRGDVDGNGLEAHPAGPGPAVRAARAAGSA
jgi:uncharacterized membrane protein